MPDRWSGGIALVVAGLFSAGTATAAETDWPCVQPRVMDLSVVQMWAGPPIDPTAGLWRDDQGVASLARSLASRRTSLDEASAAIERFSDASGPERDAK